MPNNVSIKDMVETAQQFNQNYFSMDKKQQRELRKYIKETRPAPPAQVQFQAPAPAPPPASSSESEGEAPPVEAAPPQSKPTWRSYIRLASQELKSPNSEVRATLSNIQKRAKQLALDDGYVFKNQK